MTGATAFRAERESIDRGLPGASADRQTSRAHEGVNPKPGVLWHARGMAGLPIG